MRIKSQIGLYTGALLILFGAAQPASAITIDVTGSFDPYSLTNTDYIFKRFYNQDDLTPAPASLPGNLNVSTDSVAYFGWGIDAYDSFIAAETIQSHFWFNGTGSAGGGSALELVEDEAFSLGMFTYTNEQTFLSGGVVQIDFSLDLDIGGTLLNALYQIEIDNTVNSSPTPADTASLLDPLPGSQIFQVDGIDYEILFNGFSRDGGLTFETMATLAEGEQTSAEIFATISQLTPVPVPAAFWLFGSGLIGLFSLAKRKVRA